MLISVILCLNFPMNFMQIFFSMFYRCFVSWIVHLYTIFDFFNPNHGILRLLWNQNFWLPAGGCPWPMGVKPPGPRQIDNCLLIWWLWFVPAGMFWFFKDLTMIVLSSQNNYGIYLSHFCSAVDSEHFRITNYSSPNTISVVCELYFSVDCGISCLYVCACLP